MNKADLIEALAPRLGGRSQAAAAVEAMVDVILRQVAEGGSVGITGFGTFEKVDRAPRTGRNPRTGEAVPIPGTSSPRFRPGTYFKDAVADPGSLPAEGLAGARVGSAPEGERAGAPATVRRTSRRPTDATTKKTAAPRATADRKAASGTPDTVRRTTPAPAAGSQETSTKKTAASGGRVMVGGEDITQTMIAAKKAQLAQVKNDQVVAKGKKKGKKSKKKGKKNRG